MAAFKRNEQGLVEGVHYPLTPENRIDWKALLNTKWLRVKDDKKVEVETRYAKKIKDLDLATVEDYYLYVTLGGYNEVARLRGFDSLEHHVDYVDGQKAVVTCKIHFIPNVEEPNGLTCTGVASGSIYNISPDFAAFMETIAENRAFTRAVRRALNINIVAQEELGKGVAMPTSVPEAPATEEAAALKPYAILSKRCRELGITLDKLKVRSAGIKGQLQSEPTSWTDWKDIQNIDVWTLLGKLNESAKA